MIAADRLSKHYEASDWGGAFIVATETVLVAAAFFGVGLLASQLTLTARAAAGLGALGMVLLYVLGNMANELGWFAWIRFLSPFSQPSGRSLGPSSVSGARHSRPDRLSCRTTIYQPIGMTTSVRKSAGLATSLGALR